MKKVSLLLFIKSILRNTQCSFSVFAASPKLSKRPNSTTYTNGDRDTSYRLFVSIMPQVLSTVAAPNTTGSVPAVYSYIDLEESQRELFEAARLKVARKCRESRVCSRMVDLKIMQLHHFPSYSPARSGQAFQQFAGEDRRQSSQGNSGNVHGGEGNRDKEIAATSIDKEQSVILPPRLQRPSATHLRSPVTDPLQVTVSPQVHPGMGSRCEGVSPSKNSPAGRGKTNGRTGSYELLIRPECNRTHVHPVSSHIPSSDSFGRVEGNRDCGYTYTTPTSPPPRSLSLVEDMSANLPTPQKKALLRSHLSLPSPAEDGRHGSAPLDNSPNSHTAIIAPAQVDKPSRKSRVVCTLNGEETRQPEPMSTPLLTACTLVKAYTTSQLGSSETSYKTKVQNEGAWNATILSPARASAMDCFSSNRPDGDRVLCGWSRGCAGGPYVPAWNPSTLSPIAATAVASAVPPLSSSSHLVSCHSAPPSTSLQLPDPLLLDAPSPEYSVDSSSLEMCGASVTTYTGSLDMDHSQGSTEHRNGHVFHDKCHAYESESDADSDGADVDPPSVSSITTTNGSVENRADSLSPLPMSSAQLHPQCPLSLTLTPCNFPPDTTGVTPRKHGDGVHVALSPGVDIPSVSVRSNALGPAASSSNGPLDAHDFFTAYTQMCHMPQVAPPVIVESSPLQSTIIVTPTASNYFRLAEAQHGTPTSCAVHPATPTTLESMQDSLMDHSYQPVSFLPVGRPHIYGWEFDFYSRYSVSDSDPFAFAGSMWRLTFHRNSIAEHHNRTSGGVLSGFCDTTGSNPRGSEKVSYGLMISHLSRLPDAECVCIRCVFRLHCDLRTPYAVGRNCTNWLSGSDSCNGDAGTDRDCYVFSSSLPSSRGHQNFIGPEVMRYVKNGKLTVQVVLQQLV